jgi:hypothetical protein
LDITPPASISFGIAGCIPSLGLIVRLDDLLDEWVSYDIRRRKLDKGNRVDSPKNAACIAKP